MGKPMPQAPPAPPGSLAAALAAVPDPRRPRGWRPDYTPVPLVALLQATVAAVLCGARSLYAVAQWVRERAADAPELLAALGFPAGRSTCVATLHRVYKALDVGAFETAVGGWLRQTGVAPDDPVALDGKPLRGVGGHVEQGAYGPGAHLVAAYAHGAQAVLAQLRTGGQGQELAAAPAGLAQLPRAGRVVAGRARRRAPDAPGGGRPDRRGRRRLRLPRQGQPAGPARIAAAGVPPRNCGSRAAPTGRVRRCSRPGTSRCCAGRAAPPTP